ncbi:hypothetical protein [Ascidiimonas aurantiaca]|uniref:hypothetical protein n=1 Tax=Ascidiimonas aurantiaca TaxID=1685432 RepID=UPI0030EE069E
MKRIKLAAVLAIGILLYSCNTAKKEAKEPDTVQKIVTPEEDGDKTALNTDSLVASIDKKRATIESTIGEPVVIYTDSLREKIKQKWQKMHYYVIDGEVVRIKTYPYEQITSRTEEFYVDKGNLVLVVIEDHGDAERGKPKDQLDKLYYFYNGLLIKEKHSGEEPEYTIKESDGEELASEFNEYVDIYKTHIKK